MSDWVTISSLATGGGTLLLAVATYQSVLSANRSARLAERSLLEGVRPVLIPSGEQDPVERVSFGDDVILNVPGHGAAVKLHDDVSYLAIALRNAGPGVAVLHGWHARPQPPREERGARPELLGDSPDDSAFADSPVNTRPDLDRFRRQMLDLYIPAGGTGYWQGALRDPDEPGYAEVRDAIAEDRGLWVDLLYGDYEGGQRTVIRLRVAPWPDMEGRRTSVMRYWNLDREDPR